MLRMRIDPGANHGVGVAFTDRWGGESEGSLSELNLGRVDVDEPDRLVANVAALRAATGVDGIALVHQVHGNRVLSIDQETVRRHHGYPDRTVLDEAPDAADPMPAADAMVTRVRGLALAIRVADCLPVMLADPQAGVIGAAHAGRNGLLCGVLEAVVAQMRRQGAREILAWIGPHICGSCYEVPRQMAEEVWASHPATRAITSWGTPSLDLGAEALAQLEGLGVAAVGLDPCTRESPELFSHRRDPGSGRLAGLVWIKN
ncbi:polyphenol oxidase family protein [Acidipropionibacterium jensenii]|uniref:polyphenol oxidase family protein n=1 Tax=Acidipropionibacterium jensenii TaxID=1749 RepID=UPI002649AC35|nr:polyphenol oxidase family protein [Acidipropionibacterium jensenii]MDN6592187.1 polyphenol oxidase family protein [Acidipropionibacterium jensenii]